jgi:predicted nucleic acid-binding protein
MALGVVDAYKAEGRSRSPRCQIRRPPRPITPPWRPARAADRTQGICPLTWDPWAPCPISCPRESRWYTWVYLLHGKGHGLPSRRSPRRGRRRGAARRHDSQRRHAGVRRRCPAPTPRGPSSSNAIAARRRFAPWRARRGAGEGNAPRSVKTLLLDASVLLAAFDSEDDSYEPARALLEDDAATLATLDLARYEVANVAVRAWRAPESVAPLLAAIERLASDGGVLTSTDSLLARAAELAERHTISVYDAAYAAAASDPGHRLVSCDQRDLISKGSRSPQPDPLVQAGGVNPAPLTRYGYTAQWPPLGRGYRRRLLRDRAPRLVGMRRSR